jgi:hypothetical protein
MPSRLTLEGMNSHDDSDCCTYLRSSTHRSGKPLISFGSLKGYQTRSDEGIYRRSILFSHPTVLIALLACLPQKGHVSHLDGQSASVAAVAETLAAASGSQAGSPECKQQPPIFDMPFLPQTAVPKSPVSIA